jgi:8-oxo-dGTP pyrophosphatase MutT (NUDIX family)
VSSTLVLAVVVLAALLVALVGWLLLRANRLDRLHIRTDAARAALIAALDRRAVVTRAIAGHIGDDELHRAAAAAEAAPMPGRETAENQLGRLIAALDREPLPARLADELAEAEHRVMLARRVHNDAVRDTLRLRSRRLVRWFRLAGNTPLPAYFEIADVVGAELPRPRRSGRVVLLDPADRVLLFEAVDPERPERPFWLTPGGGSDPGEDVRAAASRELAEETGLAVPPDRLVGPVWQRSAVYRFDGRTHVADEYFFLARTTTTEVDTSGFEPLEAATVRQHRWWTAAELASTPAVVYPAQLAELLPRLNGPSWDGRTLQVR